MLSGGEYMALGDADALMRSGDGPGEAWPKKAGNPIYPLPVVYMPACAGMAGKLTGL
jgi:hypothetical protein